MSKLILDPEKLNYMSDKLKAIAHPARMTIINLLQKNGKMSVGEIQKQLKIEQAATSNHLRILKDQQVVLSTRQGKNKLYSLRMERLSNIIKCIEQCD
jgi:DNA-binding transcriptional ArsR family regulator